MNMAGMIAEYFATSLAIENVVSAPRDHQELFADPYDVDEFGRIGVQVDHIAGLFGGRRAGVHGDPDIGLGQCRGVVGAVTGHRDHVAAGLLAADVGQFLLRGGFGQEIVDTCLASGAAAVNGLSPVIMTVRMPIARRSAKR